MQNLKKISKLVKNLHSEVEIEMFLKELLTESEIATLSKRWHILDLMSKSYTQRDIAKRLQVSLCKVTRGSKILKNKDSIIAKFLQEEKDNEIN